MTEPQSKFSARLWNDLRREWRRFLLIEVATTASLLLARYFSSPSSGPPKDASEIWAYALTSLVALAFGAAINLTVSFFSTWIGYVEEILERFQGEMHSFQETLTAEFTKKFALVTDRLRLPTGLKNDALNTLSRYLREADKLYSIVYVRPALWLNLGDLMNVFSLQAHYHHARLKSGSTLKMVRFIVWEYDEFLSPEGLFIIRASMLVGAQTRIITRDKLQEVVRKHGKPALQAFVEDKLHVWLECRIVDGVETPQSGRYGKASDQGFEDPLPMKTHSARPGYGGAAVIETEANFYELVELLNEHSEEIVVGRVPTHVEEGFLRGKIKDVVDTMRTAPTLDSLRARGS